MKISPEELLALSEKDAKHLILKYYAERESNEKPTNTTLSTVTAIRGFLANHYEHKLYFSNGTFAKPQIDKNSHNFSTKDLKNIFAIANTTEKAYLSLGISMGWEISGILGLEREKVKGLVSQAKANGKEHIFFLDTRRKSQEPRLGIINALAVEWVSKYLENSAPSKKLFPITQQGLNKVLKRLVKEAHIETVGRIHYHRLRAWLESTLLHAGFNSNCVDFIQGHSLGTVKRTYYTEMQQQIEEKYSQVYNEFLNIVNGNNGETKKKVEALSNTTEQLIQLLAEKDKVIEELKAKLAQNNDITKILAKKEAIRIKFRRERHRKFGKSLGKSETVDEDEAILTKFIEG
jgi:site-specific recombinase XerD